MSMKHIERGKRGVAQGQESKPQLKEAQVCNRRRSLCGCKQVHTEPHGSESTEEIARSRMLNRGDWPQLDSNTHTVPDAVDALTQAPLDT